MASELSHPKSILIVEDEADIRFVLGRALKRERYEVSEATNGQEGLDRLLSMPPIDLILLDLMMPVMDGWEFLRNKRLLPPELAAIPVLVVTGFAHNLPQELIAACLLKPYAVRDLLALVAKIIAGEQMKRQDMN